MSLPPLFAPAGGLRMISPFYHQTPPPRAAGLCGGRPPQGVVDGALSEEAFVSALIPADVSADCRCGLRAGLLFLAGRGMAAAVCYTALGALP